MNCTPITRALVLALAALGACRSSAHTAIRLEVDRGDLDFATANLARLRVRTFDSADPIERTIDRQEISLQGELSWPVSLAIVPRHPDAPSATLGIDVDALHPGDSLALRARVLTGFVRDEIRVVRVVLSRACLDASASCGPSQTCEAGACVDARRARETLPLWRADGGVLEQDAQIDTDVVSTTDSGTDAGPPDTGAPLVACTMPRETVGYRCPPGALCTPPMPPGSGSVKCCRVIEPVQSTCGGVRCLAAEVCEIDPMGHAACCSPATAP